MLFEIPLTTSVSPKIYGGCCCCLLLPIRIKKQPSIFLLLIQDPGAAAVQASHDSSDSLLVGSILAPSWKSRGMLKPDEKNNLSDVRRVFPLKSLQRKAQQAPFHAENQRLWYEPALDVWAPITVGEPRLPPRLSLHHNDPGAVPALPPTPWQSTCQTWKTLWDIRRRGSNTLFLSSEMWTCGLTIKSIMNTPFWFSYVKMSARPAYYPNSITNSTHPPFTQSTIALKF